MSVDLSTEKLMNEIKRSHYIDQLGSEVTKNWNNLGKRFSALRVFYKEFERDIINSKGRANPYHVDWKFTPIEFLLWCDIRSTCGLNFYPQFPVGRYFVDFADPIRRIALEADGKQWHDAEKDKKRDESLRGIGWITVRITGKQTRLVGVLDELAKFCRGDSDCRREDLPEYYQWWIHNELPEVYAGDDYE